MTAPASVDRCNIVQFPRRNAAANSLTKQDRLDVSNFREQAERAGYDALMIHVTVADECPGTIDYVAAYLPGEAWSRWGFARDGNLICAWNALTFEDLGPFASMSEAFDCVLKAVPGCMAARVPGNADLTLGVGAAVSVRSTQR
jgi:hypothetical protein